MGAKGYVVCPRGHSAQAAGRSGLPVTTGNARRTPGTIQKTPSEEDGTTQGFKNSKCWVWSHFSVLVTDRLHPLHSRPGAARGRRPYPQCTHSRDTASFLLDTPTSQVKTPPLSGHPQTQASRTRESGGKRVAKRSTAGRRGQRRSIACAEKPQPGPRGTRDTAGPLARVAWAEKTPVCPGPTGPPHAQTSLHREIHA